MPKLPRVTAKIFAGNAPENDLGQFGSAKNGTKITNNDISVLQELPAFTQGWSSAVISNRNYPTLQEMNSVQRIASQQIAYTLQNGMPEWDENTTYYTNQFCRVGKDFYCSKIDDNTGNNPQLATNEWELWSGGGGANTALNNLTEAGEAHFDSRYLKKTEQATITDWSFPSSRYFDLSAGPSGTEYTAPANGWIRFRMVISPATEGHIAIHTTNGLAINNYSPKGYHPETYLPIRENQKFSITYGARMTTVDIFRFYYAQGTST